MMKTFSSRTGLIATATIAATLLLVAARFERDYVIVGDGIVGVSTYLKNDASPNRPDSQAVVITGSLKTSSGKIKRVTTTQYGDVALVRVYAARIEPGDSAHDSPGIFVVAVPLTNGLRKVAVGDGSQSRTVGNIFGLSVRVPRVHYDSLANRVVWTASS